MLRDTLDKAETSPRLATAQMWYIGAPAARISCSATEATVASASTARAACAASANTPVALGAERAVEQLDELEHGDLVAGPREAVAALDAALGAQDAGAAQRREQVLEELHRDVAPAGELGDRHRAGAALAVELHQRAQRVRATWW